MRHYTFVFLFSLILVACSVQPAANVTTMPDSTPVPVVKLSADELRAKWQSPLLVSFLTYGLCQQVQKGETNRMALTLLLGIAKKGLDNWKPVEGQADIATALQGHIKNMGEAVQQDDIATAAKEACGPVETTFNDIRAAANKDGMTDEAVKAIIEDYQKQINK